jgi:hypothetical protein
MRERVAVEVAPGDILQVHTGRGPASRPITVPPGTTSVVVVFRDSKDVAASRLRRVAKRSKKKGAGRAGKRKRGGRKARVP